MTSFSVIVPAYNEERYLCKTFKSIQRAKEFLRKISDVSTEIIVVDNASTDATADIGLRYGATVIHETKRNVARARNAGAGAAQGNVFVFIDADTIVPEQLLWRVYQVMSEPSCFGGAIDTNYRPAKTSVKIYLKLWRLLGRFGGMAQGATQFCRSEIFTSLVGYNESLYMGEDVDFYWRLRRFAKRHNGHTCFIDDIQVVPSSRRFDQWSFWRTLFFTNPLIVLAFRGRPNVWRGWYRTITR